MPFTLAVYMVRYYEGSSVDEARVGRLTGLLVREVWQPCPLPRLPPKHDVDRYAVHPQAFSW